MGSDSTTPTLSQPFNNNHFENLPHAPCVSLYHRNGRVGCGTWDRGVMTGRILHWSVLVADNNGNVGNDGNGGNSDSGGEIAPYVAVIEEENYTAENIAKILSFSSKYSASDAYGVVEQGGPLRGLLVLASSNNGSDGSSSMPSIPSPEPLTPQGDGTPMSSLTIGSSYEWNVNNAGDGLTMTNMFGLPTAYIPEEGGNGSADYLRQVSMEQAAAIGGDANVSDSSEGGGGGGGSVQLNSAIYPSIVSQFNYYMGPETTQEETTVTSKDCLEWKNNDGTWAPKCLPLGGNSIWAVAGSPVPVGLSSGTDNQDNNNNDGNNSNSQKPLILLSTSIDATSMFHPLSPGANTAASNILSLLLAAKLVGSVNDETLDGLYGKIGFSFFQGESYGFIGSRRFLKDVLRVDDEQGFQCQSDPVASVFKRRDESDTLQACLNPLRADLTFQSLGNVRGMIAVDQVGNLGGGKNFYVQGGQNSVSDGDGGNGGFAGFLSEVMIQLSDGNGDNDGNNDGNNGSGYTVQASSVAQDENGEYPLPPTPLTSLVQLSSKSIGGIVLTGYDDAFVANSLYHSHLDSEKYQSLDLDAIAAAATLLARTAVAAAYQDENGEVDAATAAAYALELLPTPVSSTSETSSTFTTLYHCLFQDGNCEAFLNYGMVERMNDAQRTGYDLGMGTPLGTPPSYYVGIYDNSNGQEWVRIGGKYFGRYDAAEKVEDNEENLKLYGEDENDAFLVRPTLLEMSIAGALNNFLGRGSFQTEDGTEPALMACASTTDCSSVTYCSSSGSSDSANAELTSLTAPTCAGGVCICGSRSHYHPALDEAISPALNVMTGRFEVLDEDNGNNEDSGGDGGVVSAIYTEPYWSNDVGVRIYRDAGKSPGVWASTVGSIFGLICVGLMYRLKARLVKEKVY